MVDGRERTGMWPLYTLLLDLEAAPYPPPRYMSHLISSGHHHSMAFPEMLQLKAFEAFHLLQKFPTIQLF
jgi:hypothetical protein